MLNLSDHGERELRGSPHWRACAHQGTVLVDGEVMLQALPSVVADTAGADFDGGFAGLAFDRHCRLFHPLPEAGRIELLPWGETSTLGVPPHRAFPFDITAAGTEVEGAPTGILPHRPLALACDEAGYIHIADPGSGPASGAVWLVDSWQQEVARHIAFDPPPRDLSAWADQVFVLLADGSIWRLDHCAAPKRMPWPAHADAERLAVAPSAQDGWRAWTLAAPGHASAQLRELADGTEIAVPYATDLLADTEDAEFGSLLTLARRPGDTLLRWRIRHGAVTPLAELIAPHYDGHGIARAPDGRVAYWTAQGLRHAAPAATRYLESGRVFSFALDSGVDQCSWGQLQVEACIPTGTSIRVHAFSSDTLDVDDPIDDVGLGGDAPVLSTHRWLGHDASPQSLYRRSTLPPLDRPPTDGRAHYDAPVIVPPGRYLWLVFELNGSRGKSPRLHSARVAFPGHDLLSRLPRTLWREPAARDFLFRYLMPAATQVEQWTRAAERRHLLLDARIAPEPALPWLAGFIGLVLDPCWSATVQRRMILEAARLFRTRGTLASLQRMLELLTDAEIVIIEHFRLRGGGVVGNDTVNRSQAVLGGGYRVGGQIGVTGDSPLPTTMPTGTPPDSDDNFAHRFTVTVVAALNDAQLACVRRLIEHHKPAHTDFALCTADSGIRAGLGAHVGISSVLGRSAGFDPAILGEAALGTGFLLGRPALGDETP